MNTDVFTQQDKDEWISRLESADSEQTFGNYGIVGEPVGPHCALGWIAVNENSDVACKKIMALSFEIRAQIMKMNDDERMNLPEIAVWVKENVEVTA